MLNPAPTYLQGAVEVAAHKGASTIALVYEDAEFTASVAAGVREAALENGLQVVMDRSYPAGQADHETLAIAARDAGGDVFAGGTYYADAVGFTRAIAAVGYEPMLVTWSLPGYHAAAGFGAVEVLVEALVMTLAGDWTQPEAARDYLFPVATETVLGPYNVIPVGSTDGGAQTALRRLQVQWQDDGEGGLVLRIIHPPEAAEAAPCFLRSSGSR